MDRLNIEHIEQFRELVDEKWAYYSWAGVSLSHGTSLASQRKVSKQGSLVATMEIGAAGLHMDKAGSVMRSLFDPGEFV